MLYVYERTDGAGQRVLESVCIAHGAGNVKEDVNVNWRGCASAEHSPFHIFGNPICEDGQ